MPCPTFLAKMKNVQFLQKKNSHYGSPKLVTLGNDNCNKEHKRQDKTTR